MTEAILQDIIAQTKRDMIEECAQVVENDSFSHPDKRRLAAAIRAKLLTLK